MTPDPLADKMESIAIQWANQIIAAPIEDAVIGELHIARFKALSLYLVQTRKLGRKDADDDGAGFGAVKRAITEGSGE
jgi:hypothetical protein